ncbi:MAG: GIY-YIG nuclease family protein [Reichenbachiella sp.]
MFVVYILYSKKLKKFYVGSTNNIEDRIYRHNSGQSKFTKKGVPWELVTFVECNDRPEAVRLENRIKKRGIKRYLDDTQFGV